MFKVSNSDFHKQSEFGSIIRKKILNVIILIKRMMLIELLNKKCSQKNHKKCTRPEQTRTRISPCVLCDGLVLNENLNIMRLNNDSLNNSA